MKRNPQIFTGQILAALKREPLKMSDLARLTGLQHATVSKYIKAWHKAGILEYRTDNRTWIIK
jgi:DNA-binding IclR family transcriptional regulator